jgi:hypothetical protein
MPKIERIRVLGTVSLPFPALENSTSHRKYLFPGHGTVHTEKCPSSTGKLSDWMNGLETPRAKFKLSYKLPIAQFALRTHFPRPGPLELHYTTRCDWGPPVFFFCAVQLLCLPPRHGFIPFEFCTTWSSGYFIYRWTYCLSFLSCRSTVFLFIAIHVSVRYALYFSGVWPPIVITYACIPWHVFLLPIIITLPLPNCLMHKRKVLGLYSNATHEEKILFQKFVSHFIHLDWVEGLNTLRVHTWFINCQIGRLALLIPILDVVVTLHTWQGWSLSAA